eukprot:673891-Amphidinium_carterae.1
MPLPQLERPCQRTSYRPISTSRAGQGRWPPYQEPKCAPYSPECHHEHSDYHFKSLKILSGK